jgi:hypothetical protein
MFQNKQMYPNHLKYFENLKKELEAKKTKVANLNYRIKLKQMQDRENYLTELHRIRGVLSQNENRFPIGTRERLTQRTEELKNLIKNNAFPNEFKI